MARTLKSQTRVRGVQTLKFSPPAHLKYLKHLKLVPWAARNLSLPHLKRLKHLKFMSLPQVWHKPSGQAIRN